MPSAVLAGRGFTSAKFFQCFTADAVGDRLKSCLQQTNSVSYKGIDHKYSIAMFTWSVLTRQQTDQTQALFEERPLGK